MKVNDPLTSEKIAKAVTESDARKILVATIAKAKPAVELSYELGIPIRSVYRYLDELCELGLLAVERWHIPEGGGRHGLYRCLVKSITVNYQGTSLNVELTANEDLLQRFIKLWSYMGR